MRRFVFFFFTSESGRQYSLHRHCKMHESKEMREAAWCSWIRLLPQLQMRQNRSPTCLLPVYRSPETSPQLGKSKNIYHPPFFNFRTREFTWLMGKRIIADVSRGCTRTVVHGRLWNVVWETISWSNTKLPFLVSNSTLCSGCTERVQFPPAGSFSCPCLPFLM